MAANCSICGDKLGFGGGKPLGDTMEQYTICGYCRGQLSTIERDGTSDFAKNALNHFRGLLEKQSMAQEVSEYLNGIILFQERAEDVASQQQLAREKERQEYQQSSHAIKITSTHQLEGWRITDYCQFISSELVVGMGVFKSVMADFANLAGCKSGALTDIMAAPNKRFSWNCVKRRMR